MTPADTNILLVEDDEDINRLIADILQRQGYQVRRAFFGSEAQMCLEAFDYDIVLLDLMLPGIDGEDLIEEVRKSKIMPIIVVSAKTSASDKINALRLGADDFICKPFEKQELMARIEAQLRRYQEYSSVKQKKDKLVYKNLVLYTQAREAYVQGKSIALTQREFSILELLMSNPAKVFTRANIYESVWNEGFLGDDNTINVHISNLRSKLAAYDQGTEYIQTVWGIGFKLKGRESEL
jgi:DNA-binding response OmpR family regulator